MRACRLKLPGGEISVPVHKFVKGIKDDWERIIAWRTMLSSHTRKILRTNTILQYLWKIPLLELRQKLLTKHEHLMHLHTDYLLASFSKTDLLEYYAKHNIQLPSDLSEDNLRSMLATHERTRTIMVWHDHSEILGHDYVLVMEYDTAVFKSESDVNQKTAQSIPDLQAYIEEPEN